MSLKSVIEHEVVANHDALRFGLDGVKGDIVGSHPLQSRRDSTSRFWEEKKRMGLDFTYGSAFNLRRDLDAQILSSYPKDSETLVLARQTSLTRSQVSNWFINAPVRLWKPMIKNMYKEEFGDTEIDSKLFLIKSTQTE
ncbi:cyclin-B1-2-like [Musa acuminata AAA Group]|uniref:cyclin-B1-2-like n=1 Tax=Musa acuminata AAA Group TaxID=214697 RepID=UPI0031CF2086